MLWNDLVNFSQTYGTFRADVAFYSSLILGIVTFLSAIWIFVSSPNDLRDTTARIRDARCEQILDNRSKNYLCDIETEFVDTEGQTHIAHVESHQTQLLPSIGDPLDITYSASQPAQTAYVSTMRPRIIAIIISAITVILFGSVALNRYFVHQYPIYGQVYGAYSAVSDTASLLTGTPFSLI